MILPTEYEFMGGTMPPHLIAALDRYINHGIQPGSFMFAVCAGELFEAVGRADADNIKIIHVICAFLYNIAPQGCFGSRLLVERWIDAGGLSGIEAINNRLTEDSDETV